MLMMIDDDVDERYEMLKIEMMRRLLPSRVKSINMPPTGLSTIAPVHLLAKMTKSRTHWAGEEIPYNIDTVVDTQNT